MTRPRSPSITIAIVASLLAATSMFATVASATDDAGTSELDVVFIEATSIRATPDGRFDLLVRGQLPSPCHEPAWEVQDFGGRLDVRVWSTRSDEGACSAVLQPTAFIVPLGERDGIDVWLDGASIGSTVAPPDELDDAPGFRGAGWSFGMCLGYCLAELEVVGEDLVLTGRDRELDEPLFVNHGQMTAVGQALVDDALTRIEPTVLETVYGCPDCADGGASFLQLDGDGTPSRHEMEFGLPPDELAELYDVAMAMMASLETCVTSDLVVPDPACRAAPTA